MGIKLKQIDIYGD